MYNLKFPPNYPPLEREIDVLMPLHFINAPKRDFNPNNGSVGLAIGKAWNQIHDELSTILAKHGVEYASTCYCRAIHDEIGIEEPEFRSEIPGHDYIEIDLDKSDKDAWKRIHEETIGIIEKCWKDIKMPCPPLRYVCANSYDISF